MKTLIRILFALFVGAASTSAGYAPARAQEAPMRLPVDSTPLVIEDHGKQIASFDLEIADDGQERARGLMFRTRFPDGRAMLFVFERTRAVAFWMQNTPRSLDMIFVREDGTIASVAHDTTPFSTDAVPSGEPVRYVLEINAGLSDRLGIKPGDRLIHPRISSGAN